jgi:lysophospholipase L1-like esterase
VQEIAMSKPSVYVIGDSISIHYGPYLRDALAGRCDYDRKGGADNTDDNSYGHDGANCGDSSGALKFLRRLMEENPQWKPDLLLLNCGLHDVKTEPATGKRQISNEQYRANLLAMRQLLAQRGVNVAWVRLTTVIDDLHNSRSQFHRFAADVDALNAVADGVFAAGGCHLLDLHSVTKACGPDAYKDHVHYVEPVRKIQAAFLAWQIVNILKI